MTKRNENIDQCFYQITKIANKYLYKGDTTTAAEAGLEIRAHVSMVSDLLKAKVAKK